MKKSIIWILTIIMVLTFSVLLFIQIVYMHNMVKMRDQQFVEGVRRSLFAVTNLLEQDETRHFLEEDINLIETTSLSSVNLSPEGTTYSFSIANGTSGAITLKNDEQIINDLERKPGNTVDQYKQMQENIKNQYLHQRTLIDEVILNIISHSSDRPIYERADSTLVRNYIKTALNNNGIDIPFEFAVTNFNGVIQYRTPKYSHLPENNDKKSMFVQALFPNDPINKRHYLRVYFPDKNDYILASVKFMIPSLIFTGLLLLTSIFVIIMAFRQKRLSEMKNDFINNMTHEFKTPISSISLAGQMLNDDSVRKSPVMMQHITSVINDETKRLRFQVEKVLQMSLFDKKLAQLRNQEVDANVSIDSIVNTFQLKVERYGGKIHKHLNAENALVNVDEMHFTNVIFNLLDNAVKYRKDDVPLQLNVTTRDIGEEKIEIIVQDNGIGIKKDDLKKVFEKFYRVSTGNRHDVKGFGLGLAYVKKIVAAFGGEIKIESEYGVGTKFMIILPLIK